VVVVLLFLLEVVVVLAFQVGPFQVEAFPYLVVVALVPSAFAYQVEAFPYLVGEVHLVPSLAALTFLVVAFLVPSWVVALAFLVEFFPVVVLFPLEHRTILVVLALVEFHVLQVASFEEQVLQFLEQRR